MFVKVCGLKTFEQIDKAVELGYDAVGFVMHKPSKRYVNAEEAAGLIKHAQGRIKTFVVGVTFDEVKEAAHLADYVQVSEAVSLPNLAYASDRDERDVKCALFVYDASRGSGVYKGFPEWLSAYRDKLLISGGLSPENAAGSVRAVRPFGADVSSGVEKDGVKDYELMKKFINAVRGADI
ncbi:phosphoribosylanthranilate isomerase [Geovibrio thiophilus]|uniref:N-(5'-phosphoribosyl)anthranilate isomerase n=1 Tax=Geovibrio thiophilus TaxID=139438 RepID=A0A3R6AXN0_9BACT|nr:phosphoribosylanthranilate isomerase [Geovibrio thiophilus]QAR32861.1 phosphoribosylanthranilate isomerase [Geovibrio thiophilus]